jgi:hypothetical protein
MLPANPLPKRVDSLKGEESLTVVDAATLQVVRTYQFDEGVRPSAFTPDGRTTYTQLSHLNGDVEFDLSSGKIVTMVQMPFSDAGKANGADDYPQNSAHHGLALSGDQKKLAPSCGEVPENRADCHPCPVGDLFGRVGRSNTGRRWLRPVWHARPAQRGGVRHSGADIAPVSFACTIWRLGVPSSLPRGYVRWHRRVLSAAPSPAALVGELNNFWCPSSRNCLKIG